jgi:hypothetical protein
MGRALLSIFDTAKTGLVSFFTSNPTAATRISKRIGVPDGNISKIMKAARENPVTAAFVALEAGSLGADLLDALRDEYPEMVSQLEQIAMKPDQVDDNVPLSDLEKYKDEIGILDDVSAILGGDRNMYAVLKAAQMIQENNNILVLRERIQSFNRR